MNETPLQYPTGPACLFATAAREGLTEGELRARRDRILNDFAEKKAVPTDELLNELAEINIALGEA